MITKEQKVRLTAFLVVAGFLLAALSLIFIIPKLKNEGDVYVIDYSDISINGVNEGADVKYHGVKIGKVSQIDVNPSDLRSVLISIQVKQGFPIKKDMRASLQYAGITGLRFVEISGGSNKAQNLKPGEVIPTKKGMGEKAEDIVLNVDSVVAAVNDLLKLENRDRIGKLIENIEKSTGVISQLLEQKQGNLSTSIENIERITDQLSQVTTNLNQFSNFVNDASCRIEVDRFNRIVTNTDILMKNLSQRASQDEAGKVLHNINTLVEDTSGSIHKIETRFYNLESELTRTLTSLRESMENLSMITRELSEDPTALIRRKPEKRGKK